MKRTVVILLAVFAAVAAPFVAEASPRIVAATQKYYAQNIVEILELKDSAKNSEIDAFNNAVRATVGEFYDAYAKQSAENPGYGETYWVEIRSYPFENENFLQVVTSYIEYPAYGTSGEIASFNYDRKNNRFITLADILREYGYTENSLAERVKEWWTPDEGFHSIADIKAKGFIIFEGSWGRDVQILLEVELDARPEADTWTYFYSFSLFDDKQELRNPLDQMTEDCLFDPISVVMMKPPLRINEKN